MGGRDRVEYHEYFQKIALRLNRNFDVTKDVQILGQSIQIFAKSEIHNESYFGSKNLKLWRAENFEYCLIQQVDVITEDQIKQFQLFLTQAVDYFVKPHSEHMSSMITGVIVTKHFPKELQEMIKQFKYRKSFNLSLKGWADVRCLAVDLHSNRVISNKKGKEVQQFYLPVMDRPKKKMAWLIKK